MSQIKKDVTKEHVTATMSPSVLKRINKFCNQKQNHIKKTKKLKSGDKISEMIPLPFSNFVETACVYYLDAHDNAENPGTKPEPEAKTESINTISSNNDTVASNEPVSSSP